jgi:diguanylate cyclase (GGDEF)-like protein
MSIAARVWLSLSVSLAALLAFCGFIIIKLNLTQQGLAIMLVGTAAVALVLVAAAASSLHAVQSRLSRLQQAFDYTGQLEGTHGLIETNEPDFAKVADAFNDMAVRLSTEAIRRAEAEETLRSKARELQTHSERLNMVRRMADRLQSCTDEVEFSSVINTFAPELMHGHPGMLFLLNEAHNLLHVGCEWSNPQSSVKEFTPADCWGLRRGQEHLSGDGQVEVDCGHIIPTDGKRHRCLPLIAQSETVGLLYLEAPSAEPIERRAGGEGVTYMVRETMALGLVNLRLREKLRSQSVRDPLTGLFNRRYLDESLDLELERARRAESPVAVIMADIDHFKSFNDTFGHDAGDHVLKIVADVLARSMRKGDVAGRYGGEEFLLLMPGTDLEPAIARAEMLRETVSALEAGYGGRKLGRITASFGVAVFPNDGDTGAAVIQSADKSLYVAKEGGRDRVVATV